ncbi:MAG: sigma-70 family RNA polymerase sigma factor [Lachnospiraceae bacterium]
MSMMQKMPYIRLDSLSSCDEVISVKDCLKRLAPRYREVLMLKYYYGYNHRELAEFFGKSKSAVIKMEWRARKHFRELCKKEGIL